MEATRVYYRRNIRGYKQKLEIGEHRMALIKTLMKIDYFGQKMWRFSWDVDDKEGTNEEEIEILESLTNNLPFGSYAVARNAWERDFWLVSVDQEILLAKLFSNFVEMKEKLEISRNMPIL